MKKYEGFILYPLSILLGIVLLPVGLIWGFIACFHKHRLQTGLRRLNSKLRYLAVALDKYGNVICSEWFNVWLIKTESKHKFGHIHQTISTVIGFNLKHGTLTPLGKGVNKFLDFSFGKNHSLDAIKDPEQSEKLGIFTP